MCSATNNIDLSNELVFHASRSSGKGGQNVNKVSTKVELRFNIPASEILTTEMKEMLFNRLTNITNEGDIIVVSQSERTQLLNKKAAINKFYKLIEKGLKPRKKRIPTKPTRSSIQKREESKKKLSIKKENRKKII